MECERPHNRRNGCPYLGDFQGEGIHRELELLVESGLTPIDAISSATRNASRLMKASNDWGTLES